MKHPFNVMRHKNSWEIAPRDPMTVGLFLTAGSASAFVTYAVGFIATTLITSAITRALAPKPSAMQEGLLGNFRQAAAPWDIVYGQVRKGGTVTYMESTGDSNKYLHLFVTLAGHEVEEIGDVYINDKVVTIDGNDEVTSDDWTKDSDKYVVVKKFTGASNQDIYTSLSSMTDGPTFLNEASTNTASKFKGQGISCLYVRLEYDRDIFASGIPTFSAVVKGKKVKDPRTGVTGYSDNAALCIRDYLVSDYGLNVLESSIDDTYFSTAANDCDISSGSGDDNKFRLNGVVKTSNNIRTNLQDMVGSCVGSLFYGAGKFKLIAGVYSASVKTLTLDDLRSEISLNTKASRRDNFNSVQGTFIWGGVDDGSDTSGDWTQVDYPPITSSAFVTEDNGYENPLQLDLPLTTTSATAQRIAKQTLFRAREQMTFTADFGMNTFDLDVGDTVSLTLDRYGWDEKEFEVIGWSFRADQDAGDLRVSLTLRETSSAAFSWDGEEEDIINNNSTLPALNAGLTITNLTASAGGRTQGDGTFVNTAVLNWDDAASSFVTMYDVEWRVVGDTDYNTTTTTNSSIEISPLVDNIQYEFRVRAVTASGNTGAYATVTLTGGGDTTAPALPTSITAEGGFEYITIRWTNPADTDLRNIEVWENDTDTISGATLAGVSAGSEFVRSNLGVDVTKYYFLRAVDYSGNTSGYTSSVSATTTFLDDPDFEGGIYSLFTDQGLYAIEDVTSLPASGTFVGEKVFNRTDGKLYQWTGSAWELVIAEPDSFIASDKIIANTITGGLLATSGIITNSAQIDNAVVTNAKIDNLAVTTIKVADRAITSQTSVSVPSYSYTTSGYKTAMSVSVNASAGEEVIVGASFLLASPNEEAAFYRILWNGVEGRSGSGLSSSGTQVDPFTDIFAATAQSGTNTLQVQISCGSSTSLTKGTAFIFEAFK